jgi:hypothetical protein
VPPNLGREPDTQPDVAGTSPGGQRTNRVLASGRAAGSGPR